MLDIIYSRKFLQEVRISVPARKDDVDLWLSGSFNCFGDGSLRFTRTGSRWEISAPIPPGRYLYEIRLNQYRRIDENRKSLARRKPLDVIPPFPVHGDAGLRLAYSSGGYTILGIFNPGKSGVEILLDGPRLVSHERFDVNGIPTDVFTVRGSGAYNFKIDGKEGLLDEALKVPVGGDPEGQGIVYHIFPDRFMKTPGSAAATGLAPWGSRPSRESFYGGTLKGIRERLPYISSLGADYIYLNPVYRSRSNHRYDVDDYTRVDDLLGTGDDMRELTREAHGLGIRVILDVVFNHTSVRHPRFLEFMERGNDWYVRVPRARRKSGTYFPGYETFEGHAGMPKLNHRSQAVIDMIRQTIRYYVEEWGIDAVRVDVGHSLPPEACRALRYDGPSADGFFTVGEAWCLSPILGRLHFDSLTNYHVRRLILDYVRGRIGAADLVRGVTSECILYGQNEDRMMNILDSHDTVRLMTTLRGDRDRFMLAYTLLFILNGLATIYYGDETGLRGGRDPDCRRTMPWDEMDQELVRFFRELGSLRGHYRAARTGILECEERHGVDTILKKSGDSALRLYVFRSPGAGVRIQGEPVLWNGAIQDVGGLWKGVASGFVLSAEG